MTMLFTAVTVTSWKSSVPTLVGYYLRVFYGFHYKEHNSACFVGCVPLYMVTLKDGTGRLSLCYHGNLKGRALTFLSYSREVSNAFLSFDVMGYPSIGKNT